MYQELMQAKKGKISDLWLLVIMVAVIIVIEPITVLINSVSNPLGIVVQSLLILGIVLACIWFYKNRLRSYRLTYFTHNESLGELEEVPEGFSEYENGSILVESLVGLTGGFIALVHKSEITAFYEYGKAEEQGATTLKAVVDPKQNVYVLCFTQDNKKYKLLFQPSPKLAEQIGIDNSQEI